jgi:hypothetical protein
VPRPNLPTVMVGCGSSSGAGSRHWDLGLGSPEVGEPICDGGEPRLWSEIHGSRRSNLFRALSSIMAFLSPRALSHRICLLLSPQMNPEELKDEVRGKLDGDG